MNDVITRVHTEHYIIHLVQYTHANCVGEVSREKGRESERECLCVCLCIEWINCIFEPIETDHYAKNVWFHHQAQILDTQASSHKVWHGFNTFLLLDASFIICLDLNQFTQAFWFRTREAYTNNLYKYVVHRDFCQTIRQCFRYYSIRKSIDNFPTQFVPVLLGFGEWK